MRTGMGRRMVSWIMACAVWAGLLLATGGIAHAAAGDFEFDAYRSTITRYVGAGGDVVIPSEIDGVPVLVVGDDAFRDDENLTSVTVPEGVEQIAWSAFSGAANLVSVQLPESLKEIGGFAFNMCESLERINIPAGITRIRTSVFNSCNKLAQIALPDGLEAIHDYAFYSCGALVDLEIPAGVVYIGEWAFDSTYETQQLRFLGAPPLIWPRAFDGLVSTGTAQITVPVGYGAAYEELLGMPCVESGEAPAAADFAVPDDLIAFDAATGSITGYLGDRPRVDFPSEVGGVPVTSVAHDAFFGNLDIFIMNFAEGLTAIEDGAFKYSALSSLSLPDTLRTIGAEAFAECKMQEIALPSGIVSIGEGAFHRGNMTQITIPEGITQIPAQAFAQSLLQEAYFPSTLETIESGAFAGCGELEYLYFECYELPDIAEGAFENVPLADVDILHDASRAQADAAVEKLTGAGIALENGLWRANPSDMPPYPENYGTDIIYSETTQMISQYTGAQTELTAHWSFYVGDETQPLLGIEEGAFANSAIEYFVVPRSNKFAVIGERAFEGSELGRIDMFDSITDIGADAFRDCKNLTEVFLPESIQTIGAGAFDGCDNLTRIVISPLGAYSAEVLSALPEGRVFVAEDTTDEQILALNARCGFVGRKTFLRESEKPVPLYMPDSYVATAASDFDFEPETGTITAYKGQDLDVVVPREIDGVTVQTIGPAAFFFYGEKIKEELRSVVFPETVTKINGAFLSCHALERVEFYGAIEGVGNYCFDDCTALKTVIFHDGVASIGDYAFNFCTSLESIDFGNRLEKTGEGAFHESALKRVVAAMDVIGPQTFWANSNLTEAHIPAYTLSVGTGAFLECTALETLCIESANPELFASWGATFANTTENLTVYLPESTTDDELAAMEKALKDGNMFIGKIERRNCDRIGAEAY